MEGSWWRLHRPGEKGSLLQPPNPRGWGDEEYTAGLFTLAVSENGSERVFDQEWWWGGESLWTGTPGPLVSPGYAWGSEEVLEWCKSPMLLLHFLFLLRFFSYFIRQLQSERRTVHSGVSDEFAQSWLYTWARGRVLPLGLPAAPWALAGSPAVCWIRKVGPAQSGFWIGWSLFVNTTAYVAGFPTKGERDIISFSLYENDQPPLLSGGVRAGGRWLKGQVFVLKHKLHWFSRGRKGSGNSFLMDGLLLSLLVSSVLCLLATVIVLRRVN